MARASPASHSFSLLISHQRSVLRSVNAYAAPSATEPLVPVTIQRRDIWIQVFTLFSNRRSFAGSSIGGIRETQEMLDFCAEHGIVPEIELITAAEINAAYERVLRSDVRYRFVIDAATFA